MIKINIRVLFDIFYLEIRGVEPLTS